MPPSADLTIGYAGGSIDEGVFVLKSKETRQYWGFDINTGKQIWGPTDPEHYMQIYGTSNAIAYGNFYSTYMSGIVYCYDIKSGDLKWTYTATDENSEILWGNNWPVRISFVTDGKVYLYHGEHSPIDPKPRNAPFICLDAETGDLVWKLNSMYFYYRSNVVIGDSIMAILDSYDQRFYAIGKGPTTTSISSPDLGVPLGTSVMLKGTIMDSSPGTEEYSIESRFPQGVPAVADDDMSEWMKYVYQQFSRPEDVQGVQVKLEAVDPNGNHKNLGTTMTDMDGNYGLLWKPELEGKYVITATFEGSKSYYGSHATTYVGVGSGTTASIPISAEETGVITTEIAIITAVAVAAIIGVAAYLILRRK